MGLSPLFFGLSGVLADISLWRGHHTSKGRWLGIASSLQLGLAGAVLVVTALTGAESLGRRQVLALSIGLVALGFFGGGGLLMIWRELRRLR